MRRRGDGSVDVVLCPDGPMLLRGASTVTDSDGRRHAVERPVVAICRCGSSALAPWCDGTHKALQRRERTPSTGGGAEHPDGARDETPSGRSRPTSVR